ncbi:hypothetical protein Bca4012_059794 [Brassica carinata]|uniref:Uncharacterized protein n=1 Tax=Brassica carinata TaxID=52824 RepID=A0A8X7V5C6_BRACI|nr:hypothetical protein Bca52824_030197 [Brassica carinata]
MITEINQEEDSVDVHLLPATLIGYAEPVLLAITPLGTFDLEPSPPPPPPQPIPQFVLPLVDPLPLSK